MDLSLAVSLFIIAVLSLDAAGLRWGVHRQEQRFGNGRRRPALDDVFNGRAVSRGASREAS